jgi:hypothetical protein
MSKFSQKNLSNEKINTDVSVFIRQNVNYNAKTNYFSENTSLLRILGANFDAIIDDPYLT